MIVVLLAWSCLTRAVLGMRCPHHAQKLYSSLAETMNTRRRRGGVGFPAVSGFSSCLLSSWALVPSSSSSAWIAHWPNVRSLPGATCRCKSNRYSRSSVAGREPACLPISSVPVSRAVCLYSRVICLWPLSSSCGCSSRPACHCRSVPACLSSSRLAVSRFDCIIWRGRAWLSCGDGKKKRGRVLIPRPLAYLAVFSDGGLRARLARFCNRPGWSHESRSRRSGSCRTGRE